MIYAPGVTSKSVRVQIVDDSGLGVTGLVAATFPAIFYWIAGANAAVSITLSDLSLITTVYSSGGVKELSGGYYRLDIPDAALAGAGKVSIYGEATGKHAIVEGIDVGYPQSDVRQLIGTTLTEGAGGRVKAAFTTLFDVATPVLTTASVNQTGDAYARIGVNGAGLTNIGTIATVTTLTNLPTAPTDWLTGASVKADAVTKIQAGLSTYAGGDTAGTTTLLTRVPSAISLSAGAVTVGTNNDKTGYSLTQTFPTNFASLGIGGTGHITNVDTLTTYTGNTLQTGDSFARLGAPTLASIAVDIQARLATSGYTAPHNSNIDAIFAKLPANAIADETLVIAATNSILSTLGTPTGASISADVATKPTLANILAGGDIDGFSIEQFSKLCLAVLTGKLSGATTTTIVIKAADDSKTRVTATVDSDGNRTAVTLDAAG